MTLGDLIKEYRTEHNLSQRQFAIMCGLSNGYISMLEKGENPSTKKPVAPSLVQLQKIAAGLGITVMDLMERVDDMPIDLDDKLEHQDVTSIPNAFPLPKSKDFPLIGSIACGQPILATENLQGHVSYPDDIDADFCLRCQGDSMINARIFDGDIVFIRQQPQVENGEIAAVRIGEEATLKKVYYVPSSDRITLRACNPLYPDMEYSGEELDHIEILGKAVAFLSKVL